MTHLSLPAACIPTPPLQLNPYPCKWTITSWFPIDIAMHPDLACDPSDCISGLPVPTDVTLLFCPLSLPLLYTPNPFLTESCLSQVQCSVLLVIPEFWTISLFDHLLFPMFLTDVDCCGHLMGRLRLMFDLGQPLLTIGMMY